MKPTKIEIDLTSARTNQAGEISNVVLRAKNADDMTEVTFGCNAAGIQRNLSLPNDVAVTDHYNVMVSEAFATQACKDLGFDLEGRSLEELDSSHKIRKFLPVGRKVTYMER